MFRFSCSFYSIKPMRTSLLHLLSKSTHTSDSIANPIVIDKIQRIREILIQQSIDAFIIPTDDPHMSEYTASYFARREFISGFTGSAGTAIITKKEAVLFTDGRYHSQAEKELDDKVWILMKVGIKGVPSPTDYLLNSLQSGAIVGIDPSVHNCEYVKKLNSTLHTKNIGIKMLSDNPIDQLWSNRPSIPNGKIRSHALSYAGISTIEKVESIRKVLIKNSAHSLVIAALDEIAWMFNLRGCDVECNPVFLSYSIVTRENIYLFVEESKLSPDATKSLKEANIQVLAYNDLFRILNEEKLKGKVWIDPKSINQAIYSTVKDVSVIEQESPIVSLKAQKNQKELKGMRECHIRDGAAVVEFLAWLDHRIHVEAKDISEYDIDIHLTAKRKQISHIQGNDLFLEPSFPTIAGVNENAAIIHYR